MAQGSAGFLLPGSGFPQKTRWVDWPGTEPLVISTDMTIAQPCRRLVNTGDMDTGRRTGLTVAEYDEGGLIACHSCDAAHSLVSLPEGATALCRRCGDVLYRNQPNSLDRATALYLASLILFFIANSFPFIALQYGDRIEQSLLWSAGLGLEKMGMGAVGLLVFLTSVIFPFITLVGMLSLLLPLRLGVRPTWQVTVWRVVRFLQPWSLLGVFMLGLLVSIVKLQDLAVIVPGVGFYAFIGLLAVSTAAAASFDAGLLWPRVGPVVRAPSVSPDRFPAESAAALGLVECHVCKLLVRQSAEGCRCPRCGCSVHAASGPAAISTTWALLFTAALLLVPANLYPVMTVIRFGMGEPNTILSGVIHLVESGAWPLALLVFFASFVVPVGKLVALGFLAFTTQRQSTWRRRERTVLYRAMEFLGAWSMVDIFLVGILVSLVRMEGLAVIYPGIGAAFFAASVVVTMMAAHAFDPRLIWGPDMTARRSK